MSFVRTSKFRHVFGSPFKPDLCYNSLKTEGTGDTNCAVSGKFLAVVKVSKVFVIPLEKFGRQEENNLPYLDCKSKVLDVQWSPFNDCVLATAEESGDINVWNIPDDGLKATTSEPFWQLHGEHTRKVTMVQWHPSADYILATSGADNFVTVWNCESQSVVTQITVGEMPTCIAWNYDGSRLGITTKEERMISLSVADPRTGNIIAKQRECYQGMKPTKLAFLRNGNVLTIGADRQAEKSIVIWDKQSLEKLTDLDLGSSSAVINVYYDGDLGVLYTYGKGESTVKFYEIDENSNEIFYLSTYSSTSSQKGGNFMPKRCVNTSTTEVARFYKLHSTKCEPISLIVPRKSEHFQKDIYPDCASDEPAMTADEWISGANKDPLTMEFKASSSGSKKEPKKISKTLTKKPLPTAVGSSAASASDQSNAAGVDLSELLEDMKKVKATVRKLNKRVAKLEEMLEQQDDGNEEEEEEEEE